MWSFGAQFCQRMPFLHAASSALAVARGDSVRLAILRCLRFTLVLFFLFRERDKLAPGARFARSGGPLAASFPKKKEKHECKISSLWKDRSFRRGFYFTLCRLRSSFSVPLSLCDWRSSRCKLCSCRDVRRNIAQRCRALPSVRFRRNSGLQTGGCVFSRIGAAFLGLHSRGVFDDACIQSHIWRAILCASLQVVGS